MTDMDEFMGPDPGDKDAADLKRTLIEVITWAERNTARSLQAELGPSDLGSACDRRIGYKMAGMDVINTIQDPWSAFVGSAIHTRLQDSIDRWTQANHQGPGERRFLTESLAPLDDFIKAHPDLLDREKNMVVDHKSTTMEFLKQLRKPNMDPHVAFPGYIIQVQLYGLAFENLGHKIEKVALAFYPRAGWLKNMYCWVGDYDRDVAMVAYQRPYDIADVLTDLAVTENPSRWAEVPAEPSNACGFCPWYNSQHEGPANDGGCPGT